jgi:hypothetical protein
MFKAHLDSEAETEHSVSLENHKQAPALSCLHSLGLTKLDSKHFTACAFLTSSKTKMPSDLVPHLRINSSLYLFFLH